MDRVTVVVPTHNRPDLLTQTLKSVLWQRDVELEVVVVDDGSSVDVAPVVERLADDRVRLIRREPAQGVSAARNRGAADASGLWVAFVDDDDLWAPDKLALQVAAAEGEGASWAYAGEVTVTLDLRVVGGAPPPAPPELAARLRYANAVPGSASSVVVDAGLFRTLGGFDLGYRHFADWDLWLRLLGQGPPAWVPRPLIGYRVHATNRSLDTEGMLAELDLIEQRHDTSVDRVAFFRHVARVCLRAGRNRDALGYYLQAKRRMRAAYPLTDFASDTWVATSAALRARVRNKPLRRVLTTSGSKPPHPEWLEEGRSWVRELAEA